MTPAGQRLEVTVAPESGTGELAGLTGKMAISFPDGEHSYALEYELPGVERS
jgi:hypothetical protein